MWGLTLGRRWWWAEEGPSEPLGHAVLGGQGGVAHSLSGMSEEGFGHSMTFKVCLHFGFYEPV